MRAEARGALDSALHVCAQPQVLHSGTRGRSAWRSSSLLFLLCCLCLSRDGGGCCWFGVGSFFFFVRVSSWTRVCIPTHATSLPLPYSRHPADGARQGRQGPPALAPVGRGGRGQCLPSIHSIHAPMPCTHRWPGGCVCGFVRRPTTRHTTTENQPQTNQPQTGPRRARRPALRPARPGGLRGAAPDQVPGRGQGQDPRPVDAGLPLAAAGA